MLPYASKYRFLLNICRYSCVSGRPFLPRSRRTLSTTAASCIAHASWPEIIHRLCPFALWTGFPGRQIGRSLPRVGWAARRGPGFTRGESWPFPGSLPPNRTCRFPGIRLSSDLCRVRDGVRVNPVMARCADDKRLAPHSCHECGPRGLAASRFPEFPEAGDLVDCHRAAGFAEFAFPFVEPREQFLAGNADPGRGRVGDDRPPVLPQVDPAESCNRIRLASPLPPGLEAGPGTISGGDLRFVASGHLGDGGLVLGG